MTTQTRQEFGRSMSKRNTTKKNRPEVPRPLPIEVVALSGAIVAFLLTLAYPVRFYFPDTHSSAFALEHYLLGIFIAAILLIGLQWRARDQFDRTDILHLGREMLALSLVIFLHFNFKLWAQLINPHRFDAHYHAIDQALIEVHQLIEVINLGFTPLKTLMPNAYHDVFVGIFLASFIMLGATARRLAFRQCLLAVTLVLLIGGLGYIPFPALGPFVFQPNEGIHAYFIQQDMLNFMEQFLDSSGVAYTGGNFIMPLAAMPSLHVAHAYVLLYFTWVHMRWLGYIYLPIFIFLTTEAVSSRWHYLADLPAGMLIAVFCIKLSEHWLPVARNAGDDNRKATAGR